MTILIVTSLISILVYTYVAISAYINGEAGVSKQRTVLQQDIDFWKQRYNKKNSYDALQEYKKRYNH